MIDSGYVLSICVFAPFAFGVISVALSRYEVVAKVLTFFASLIPLFLGGYLLSQFDSSLDLQFIHVANEHWLGENFDIKYKVGLDGFSIMLFLFSTFIFPISIVFSFRTITSNYGLFGLFILLLETAVLGVFASLDIFQFFIFWETLLIPVFVITVIWGGRDKRVASTHFLIYMFVGSILLLIGIIYIGFLSGINGTEQVAFTSDYEKIRKIVFPDHIQHILFWLFGISFLLKAPIVPLHTWLPPLFRTAPISVIITGIVLKMATYALLRFNILLFPASSAFFSNFIGLFAIISILYGAFLAFKQDNMFGILAYSSISHVGFVLLGLFAMTPLSIQGSIFQMIAHGVSLSLLLFVMDHLRTSRESSILSDFGGLKKSYPFVSLLFLIGMLGNIGLPGLSGFVGEFLILLGTFESPNFGTFGFLYGSIAVLGVILSASYMLPVFQSIFLEKENIYHTAKINRLSIQEFFSSVVLMIFIFWIGIASSNLLKYSEKSTSSFNQVKSQPK